MKLDVMPSVIQMEDETFKQLVAEVKETMATVDLPGPQETSFGPIDLWNIRRQAKSASTMFRR